VSIRHTVLLFVFPAAFITYLDRVCISVAALAIQADLGLTPFEMGWVFTAFYVAYAIFEIPASYVGDRWGQRRTLVRIVGGWPVFTMMTGLASGSVNLLIIRFFFGAAESGAFPTRSRALSPGSPRTSEALPTG